VRHWIISSIDAIPAEWVDEVAEWYRAGPFVRNSALVQTDRAWLMQTSSHPHAAGPGFAALWAVYQTRHLPLEEVIAPHVDNEWGPYRNVVLGPSMHVRQVAAELEFGATEGDWWCSVRIDAREGAMASAASWSEFESWYSFVHMPETCIAEGLHHAWRLGSETRLDGDATTLHVHDRWAIYEMDRPEQLMDFVVTRPVSPLWEANVEPATLGRTYHRVIARS
jgi:hypothetical protein